MFLLGLIILLSGLLFLFRNLGLLNYDVWSLFWPSLLVILGLYFVLKKINQ